MLNRFGFLIAVLVFGGALFGIGLLSADSEPAFAAGEAEVPPAADPSAPVPENKADAKADLPSISDLLPRLRATEDQRYTLLLARFAVASNAQDYVAASPLQNLAMLQAVDEDARQWWLVTSGDYSAGEVEQASYELRVRHGLTGTPIRTPSVEGASSP